MSAFTIGIASPSIYIPTSGVVSTWQFFTGSVPFVFTEDGKRYLWHKARIAANGALHEQREPSLVEMAKMAQFLERHSDQDAALAQLKAYVYAGLYLLNTSEALPVAA